MAQTINTALTTGIKQILNDASSVTYKDRAQLTLDFHTYSNYKLLKSWIRVKGKVTATLATPLTTAGSVGLVYKSDYTYRLFENFLFKLNSNIEVRQLNDLSYLRFYSALENIGRLPLENIPVSFDFKANEQDSVAEVEFLLPLWFIMPDMINQTQTFIYTELYNTIQAIFSTNDYNSIVKSATAGATKKEVGTDINFKLEANIDSVSEYWIVNNDYLQGATQQEVLAKMGAIFKVNTYQDNFTGSGKNLYIRIMPTTELILKDLTIICRDKATGQRVDNAITRLELRNGDRPLMNVSPNIIRQEMIDRYDLSWDMFKETDETQKDKQGLLYGVLRVDSSIFGDLENGLRATGNWNQPYLYFDLDQQVVNSLGGGIDISVFQSSVQVPSVLQSLANQYVRKVRG